MIDQWDTKEYNGHHFEMLAVARDREVVGFLSFAEKTPRIVSIGPEIFEEYRGRGLGKAAMAQGMDYARMKAYQLVVQQIREDNAPSLALHRTLGFETDGYVFRNRHGNPVLVYVKVL